MTELRNKALFGVIATIGALIVLVDFTSWIMSALTEAVLVGALLAVVYVALRGKS